MRLHAPLWRQESQRSPGIVGSLRKAPEAKEHRRSVAERGVVRGGTTLFNGQSEEPQSVLVPTGREGDMRLRPHIHVTGQTNSCRGCPILP